MTKTQATTAAKIAQLRNDSQNRLETLDNVLKATEETAKSIGELRDDNQRVEENLRRLKAKILKTISKREERPSLNKEHGSSTMHGVKSPHEQISSSGGLVKDLLTSRASLQDIASDNVENSDMHAALLTSVSINSPEDEAESLDRGSSERPTSITVGDCPEVPRAKSSDSVDHAFMLRLPTKLLLIIGKSAQCMSGKLMKELDNKDGSSYLPAAQARWRKGAADCMLAPLRLADVNKRFRAVYNSTFWTDTTFAIRRGHIKDGPSWAWIPNLAYPVYRIHSARHTVGLYGNTVPQSQNKMIQHIELGPDDVDLIDLISEIDLRHLACSWTDWDQSQEAIESRYFPASRTIVIRAEPLRLVAGTRTSTDGDLIFPKYHEETWRRSWLNDPAKWKRVISQMPMLHSIDYTSAEGQTTPAEQYSENRLSPSLVEHRESQPDPVQVATIYTQLHGLFDTAVSLETLHGVSNRWRARFPDVQQPTPEALKVAIDLLDMMQMHAGYPSMRRMRGHDVQLP